MNGSDVKETQRGKGAKKTHYFDRLAIKISLQNFAEAKILSLGRTISLCAFAPLVFPLR
jgi:hypothetical protein